LTGGTVSDSMKSFWDKGWENRFNNTDHAFLKDETHEELRKLHSIIGSMWVITFKKK